MPTNSTWKNDSVGVPAIENVIKGYGQPQRQRSTRSTPAEELLSKIRAGHSVYVPSQVTLLLRYNRSGFLLGVVSTSLVEGQRWPLNLIELLSPLLHCLYSRVQRILGRHLWRPPPTF
ncbi:hypothetical protein PM082_014237 [Marasmius tenuissimus]|nr:hypothetical protein PM082_014237 [Marasmius tenuissimus]